MRGFLKDFRYALRLLRRSPGFTLVALGSLALGIGANTAIFSLLNAVVLRPMPVEAPDRLVAIFQTDEQNPGNLPISHLNFEDLREINSVLTDMAAVSFGQVNLRTDGDDAGPVPIQIVSGNYFDVLRPSFTEGRPFAADEDGAPGAAPVAVMSWPLWQRRFGGDPGVVGRTVTMNRTPFTVVGIAPRTFTGTFPFGTPGFWVPMAMHDVVQPEMPWYEQRRGLFLFPVGRLQDGVTLAQAQANFEAIMASLAEEFPVDNAGRSAALVPLLEARINPNGQGQLMAMFTMLMGLVGVVLLIACANLANLLLARGSRRKRELSVRLAIGAGRARLARQLLTESVTLSFAGGVLGVLLANWMLRLLASSTTVLPFPIEASTIGLDGRVLLFTLIVSVATGLVFGLAPALDASRTDVVGTIKQESGTGEGRGWLRKSLVASQVALCVISLVAAGLFLRSLRETLDIDPGFEPANVTTLAVNLGREGYSPEEGALFYERLVERALALPGVRSAAVAENLPLAGVQIGRSVYLNQDAAASRDRRIVSVNYVSGGYFDTTSIPILRGRDFDRRDTSTSPSVAIVNETMADEFWPEQDALGQRFYFFGDDQPTEVIAVARDSKVSFLGEDPVSLVYEPLSQDYRTFGSLLVSTAGPAPNVASTLRGMVAELDPGLTILNLRTLDEQVQASLTGQQTLTVLMATLGTIALLLATMGLYGVASYWVSHRTREIGIRMALGARPARMLALVVAQAMRVVIAGMVLGLLVAGLAAGLLGAQIANLLVAVDPVDPVTFGATILILLAVAVLACAVPARRAARIDPLLALRQD